MLLFLGFNASAHYATIIGKKSVKYSYYKDCYAEYTSKQKRSVGILKSKYWRKVNCLIFHHHHRKG